jgi:hypothetical protein
MSRTISPKQIGVKIDPELWKEMRVLALQQDITATEALNRAMREYLERHGDKESGRSRRTK